MRKVIHNYGLPEDMSGMTVLDVGTATGFFAFECARRGAMVTAIDIWDGTMFEQIRDGLGLEVRYLQKDIYGLNEKFGRFDLVICGSLLLHLRDVFGAVQCLRSVCGKQLVLTSSFVDVTGSKKRALAEFIGARAHSESGEYWVYWNLTPECLLKMVKACDYAIAQEIARFDLISEPGRSGFRVPHVVVHGLVE